MRYNWFSSPLKPLVGGSRHGSSSGFGAAVRAFRVPVLGAVICWNSGNAVLHVNGSSGGLSGGLATFTGSSLTCQTFCRRVVVSGPPNATSRIDRSSSAVRPVATHRDKPRSVHREDSTCALVQEDSSADS